MNAKVTERFSVLDGRPFDVVDRYHAGHPGGHDRQPATTLLRR
jgi:hypothetical protein